MWPAFWLVALSSGANPRLASCKLSYRTGLPKTACPTWACEREERAGSGHAPCKYKPSLWARARLVFCNHFFIRGSCFPSHTIQSMVQLRMNKSLTYLFFGGGYFLTALLGHNSHTIWFTHLKSTIQGLPWWSSDLDSTLPSQGHRFSPWLGNLRSHMVCSLANK